MSIHFSPNKITGANAGGPRQLPIRAHWAARIAQFRRSAYSRILSRLQILVVALTLALVGCHKSRHMICQACQKHQATVEWHGNNLDTGRSEDAWLCQACADSRTPPEVLQRIREARARGETGAISGWTSYPLPTNRNEKP